MEDALATRNDLARECEDAISFQDETASNLKLLENIRVDLVNMVEDAERNLREILSEKEASDEEAKKQISILSLAKEDAKARVGALAKDREAYEAILRSQI